MYDDWKKEYKPDQFVKSLPKEVYKLWDQYMTAMNDIAGINIIYNDLHYKYHKDKGNIKPLVMGRGPLPENRQLKQYNAMNKTSHPRPQYYKFVSQIISQYNNNKLSNRDILKELQNGLIYEQPYGLTEFIRLLALHGKSTDKIKSAGFLIAKRIYDKIQGTHPKQYISLQKIRDSLNKYIDEQIGEDPLNTKDLVRY